jgi:hypothetical protein
MKSLIWILALLLTASAAVYQRMTGPTYPIKTEVNTGIQKFPVKLFRSHSGTTDCPVVLQISDITVKGVLQYRKYPTHDEMTKVELKREGDKLVGSLPNQPPAGKIEYKVDLLKDGTPLKIGNGAPVVIRYTGDVPKVVLIIHIFLMFFAMLLSNVTGMFAIFKIGSFKYMSVLTFIVLMIGGLILGPLVQKYAFNEWWAGVPYGWDLTDNKTLIAIMAWLLALVMIRHKSASFWVIAASLVTIIIFSIPHSLYGSELNQETGKIIQGNILPLITTFLK